MDKHSGVVIRRINFEKNRLYSIENIEILNSSGVDVKIKIRSDIPALIFIKIKTGDYKPLKNPEFLMKRGELLEVSLVMDLLSRLKKHKKKEETLIELHAEGIESNTMQAYTITSP